MGSGVEVAVGPGVAVGDLGVSVGNTGVAVGATGVDVGAGRVVLHATKTSRSRGNSIAFDVNAVRFIAPPHWGLEIESWMLAGLPLCMLSSF
jgi:hypothetical protein